MSKRKLRNTYRKIRDSISVCNRKFAEKSFVEELSSVITKAKLVASYCSFKSEFSTELINTLLANQNKLCLPRVDGKNLLFYRPEDYPRNLEVNRWGILEPVLTNQLVQLDDIDLMLIPALAFDSEGFRIGYGGGFYDKVLSKYKGKSWGIGYLQQHSPSSFLIDEHDLPCEKVFLF